MRASNQGSLVVRTAAVGGLLFSLLSPIGAAAQSIESDAETVMRSMASFMDGLTSFSVTFETDSEIIDGSGQKLMFVTGGRMDIQRPDKIHVVRQNSLAEVEMVFDGKELSLLSRAANAYFQMAVEGTVDDVIDAIRGDLDYDAPGADLLYSDLYNAMMGNVTEGRHLGMATVDGVEAHHLAFRTDQVDWQLWVAAGDEPVPLRYVITTKWLTGAPQYAIRLSDWNVDAAFDAGLFTFAAPDGARRMEGLQVNAIGELEEEVQ